jgi:hypothetical protein
MEATIENLSKGKCAIKNDGTAEELYKVLKTAFPKDEYSFNSLENNGRMKCEYFERMGPKSNLWDCDMITYLPYYSVKEFLKNMATTPNKKRFITAKQAQSIINISCSTWKPRLAKLWSENIVLNEIIAIEESFYTEMRNACTESQNTLFDEIFGTDKPIFTAKKDEWVVITDKGNDMSNVFSTNKPYQLREDLTGPEGVFRVYKDNDGDMNGYGNIQTIKFRLATPEEIAQVSWYPHLTPCLVSNGSCDYLLRYSAKEIGHFYEGCRKSGTAIVWSNHRKLDINNLPEVI